MHPNPSSGCDLSSAEGAIDDPPGDDRALRTLVAAAGATAPASGNTVRLAALAEDHSNAAQLKAG